MNKQQIIDLWRLSFNDTEEFIRLYFDRVYKEENTLVIEKDGQVVSALQMLPYTMTYYGTEISVAYISGACTLPSMRGKGLMKQLMQKAFDEMKYRSVAVAALIPADPWLPGTGIYGNVRLLRGYVYTSGNTGLRSSDNRCTTGSSFPGSTVRLFQP